jgi:regulator of protease activity HflC (stomatin/prohibitin superfamily)
MPIELFRISSVTVPDSIIELSLESQIALQNNDLLEKTQKVAVIRAETDRLVATITAQTKQVLQFANNEAKRLVEKATSYANRIEITARAEGIHTMLVALNISDTTKSAANNDTAFTTQLVRTLALLDNAVNTTIVPGVGDVLVNVNG